MYKLTGKYFDLSFLINDLLFLVNDLSVLINRVKTNIIIKYKMNGKTSQKFKCAWCDHVFSSKANLLNHEKTAKYCLKTRVDNVEENLSTCDICGKIYSQIGTLQKHYKKCSAIRDEKENKLIAAKNEVIIKELEETNKTQQKLLKKQTKHIQQIEYKNLSYRKRIMAQKEEIRTLRSKLDHEQGVLIGYKESKPPTIVNNTIINNKLKMVPTSKIKPFTTELIEANSETYTYDQFIDMKDGLISHLLQTTVFEDEDGRIHKNYVCTNRARNTFHILLSADDWKLDPGAYEIHNYLDSLRPFAEEHYKQFKVFFDSIKYGDDKADIQYYKEHGIKLLDFIKAFREGPCDANREKLLKLVRTGIKKRLSV